jgi:hypothetical protein
MTRFFSRIRKDEANENSYRRAERNDSVLLVDSVFTSADP